MVLVSLGRDLVCGYKTSDKCAMREYGALALHLLNTSTRGLRNYTDNNYTHTDNNNTHTNDNYTRNDNIWAACD